MLTTDDVAAMLKMSTASLRTSMSAKSGTFYVRLGEERLRLGKRNYWRAETIADLLEEARNGSECESEPIHGARYDRAGYRPK
ncbi:MAG: hypothetical protein CMP06_08295 [Xanthomonadales bacterium]|nr:hypothetical protein [Xanthomonadales bacterium]